MSMMGDNDRRDEADGATVRGSDEIKRHQNKSELDRSRSRECREENSERHIREIGSSVRDLHPRGTEW